MSQKVQSKPNHNPMITKADVTTIADITGYCRDYVYRVLVKGTRKNESITLAAQEILRMKRKVQCSLQAKGHVREDIQPEPTNA